MHKSLLRVVLACGCLFTSSVAGANALDHLRTTDDIGLNKVPHLGRSNILVIPHRVGAGFSTAELQRLQFIFDPAGGVGTFRDYWKVVSGGRYDPVPTMVDPIVYTDRCPIPGKSLSNCTFSFSDIQLLNNGGLKTAFEDILQRVRDESGVDLGQFDINTAQGPGHDGYFDGVIMDSDMYNGIGFPLAAFNQAASVSVAGPGMPDAGVLTSGIVAMVPPDLHEFGHVLGFIDLYGGPHVNDLMEDTQATLSAFSRQQIGWGEIQTVTQAQVMELLPVLEGGAVLKFGTAPRYVLVENRGGPQHDNYDSAHAGIYIYSVDESELPTTALGFVNILAGGLYLPNEAAPYLNVVLPVGCDVGTASSPGECALVEENSGRVLKHANGTNMGFSIRRGKTQPNGSVPLSIVAGTELPPEFDGGGPVDSDAGTTSSDAGAGPTFTTGSCLACSSSDVSITGVLLAGVILMRKRRSL